MMVDSAVVTTGASSCFGIPGDGDSTDKILRAVPSCIPRGNAVEAGDIRRGSNCKVTNEWVEFGARRRMN